MANTPVKPEVLSIGVSRKAWDTPRETYVLGV